jgi:hypothetical protein
MSGVHASPGWSSQAMNIHLQSSSASGLFGHFDDEYDEDIGYFKALLVINL